jgi:hypothetical protein
MKIAHETFIVNEGTVAMTDDWLKIAEEIRTAIAAVTWPPGSSSFTINPIRRGNGVKPIKQACMSLLRDNFGWNLESKFDPAGLLEVIRGPGKFDATRQSSVGVIALEWETGNISSTHRALNKMALGLIRQIIVGGVLILPTRRFYRYLTDRIGNFEEVEPYFPLWKALNIDKGFILAIGLEHDYEDETVARITKGTDGRALR